MSIKLLPHQEKAFRDTKAYNKVAYYLDMGLGKTFLGSEKAVSFENQILVVCQKSKVQDWVDHFNDHYKDEIVSDLTKKGADYTAGVLIINYDIVWRRPELLKLKRLTAMLDESSCVKNPKSKRTKIFTGSKRPKVIPLDIENLILLSGTPTAGKYEDIITQANLLGWAISKDEFYERFCKTYIINNNGWPIEIVYEYKNVDQLKSELRKYGCIFMKSEEVLNLPKQNEIIVNCNIIKQYKEFYSKDVCKIKDIELVGDTPLSKRIKLRQICGSYNTHKLSKLEDLIDSTEDRILIFYNFKEEFEKIKEVCKKHKRPISYINGDGRNLKNYEEKSNSVTILQYQAGAMGLNLQKANKTIYYSPTERVELYEQSLKRTHRIGQERPCFYYHMISKGTIEKLILEAVKRGEDYNAVLFERGH